MAKDNKRKGMKTVKCMNHDPENSKWGEYAPEDGPCEETLQIDERSTKGLCWRCTSRSVTMVKTFRSE
jgi:hypothetical protein